MGINFNFFKFKLGTTIRNISITAIFIVVVLISNQKYRAFQANQIKKNKLAWSKLIGNHPYNNRAYLTNEELKKVPATDRPDLAMEQDYLMTMDPALGIVPTERKIQANIELAKALKLKAAISGVNWQERGPNNVGGRTRALMFDPNDVTNKKVWAAGVSGGLWYTNDITATSPTWNHVNDFWDNIAVSCIAFNPNNTQEFYVGTGEGWFNADAQIGSGIWKTSDGGSTWSHLASTDPGPYVNSTEFQYVNKIVIKDDGTIFAATRGYYTNYGGIVRSTDGGVTWTNVLNIYVSGTYSGWAADIEIAANGDLYTSFGIFSAGQVYKSLNADNGASGTWTNLSTNIGMANAERIELACAPSDADIIYAVARGGSGDNDIEWFKKSIDGGTNWTSCVIPLMVDGSGTHFTRGQAFYDLILSVHPSNPDLVIAGGIDLHRSLDGGATWSGISHWYGGFSKPEVHADLHAIQFRPGASDEVIFGSDGGIAFSTNAGDAAATPSFSTKNSGYNVTQFYACAAKNEVASNYFLGGTQDNGSLKFKTPQIGPTIEVTGGDGAFCHIDQIDPNIQTTSYVYNSIYRSLDGGNTFSSISTTGTTGYFINPSEYDSQRKIFYAAAGNDLLRRITSFDGTYIDSDLAVNVGVSKVSALKMSPYNDVLFLGIANGRIYKYTNASTATPTLTQIDSGLPISAWPSSIDIGVDDNNILITFSNYGVQSVWETVDGGTTWYDKEGNLPDIPIRWALFNPNNRSEVLLATELGVWSTDNFQSGTANAPDWGASNTDLAHTRCTMLKYRAADKMVVVSTHGRGLFTTDIFVENSVADFAIDNQASCTGSLTVNFTDGSLIPNNSWAWDIDNDGITDYTSQNPTHTYSSPGLYSVKLTVNNGAAATVKENLILVMSSELTANTQAAVSNTLNLNNGGGVGIYRFALASIDNTTSHNDGAYHNYTCSNGTSLDLGKSYDISIHTGTLNIEGARVYIDYNDDGAFTSGESVAIFSANTDGFRTTTFTTPISGVVLNKGLRLRVLSKFGGIPSFATDVSSYGQAEDYTVYFTTDANWTGITSTDWNTTTNWSYGTVPTSAINAIIPTGLSNYPIITGNVDCNNITIQSGASATINSGNALTVNGTLTNNGTLTINSDETSNGSLQVVGSSSGDIIYNRYMTGGLWHLISSPTGGTSINADFITNNSIATQIPKYGLAPYNNSTPGWQHYTTAAGSNDIASAGNFAAGKGYELLRSSDGTVSFTGTVATSDVSIGIIENVNAWNLVGNPYSSAINGNTPAAASNNFLTVNTAALHDSYEAIYFWNAASSAYITANQTSGPFHVAPGQAFFVYSVAGGSSVSFMEAMQTHQTAAPFYKNDNQSISTIKLLAAKDENSTATTIMYIEDMTRGLDPGYDAGRFSAGDNSFALYTHLVGDNENLVDFDIQCLPTNDFENIVVPVGLNAPEGSEIIFSVELTDFPTDLNVYLEDREKGEFTNLDEFSTYSIYTDNEISGTGRFFIHTVQQELTSINEGMEIEIYRLIPQRSNGTLQIRGKIDEDTKLALYNIAGQSLGEFRLNRGDVNNIVMPTKKSGVYMAIIQSQSNMKSIKFVW